MGVFARAAKSLAFGGTGIFDQGVGTIAAGQHMFGFGFGRSQTGQQITTASALGTTPFWAGVRILAESVAQVPLLVYRRLPDGGKERARDHWLYPVLHDRPNPRLTSFQWRETLMGHECTWGNHYSAKAVDGTGAVRELWPLSPERMTVRMGDDGMPIYDYQTTGQGLKTLTHDQVYHVSGLAWDGLVGMSPVEYHKNAIGFALATQEHGNRFFSNGANPSFVLATDKTLGETAIDNLKKFIADDKQGVSNAWNPWILEEGIKPITLSMPNDQAQWLESRKFQVHEIARILNIPPYKLGSTEPGAVAYKSVEQYAVDFVVGSLTPWFVRIEQAAGMQLLGPDWTGNGGDYFVSFAVDGLLRGDQTQRYLSYHQAILDGWMVRNEVRETEDMNRLEGLDAPLIPLNVTTVAPDGTTTRTEYLPTSTPTPES